MKKITINDFQITSLINLKDRSTNFDLDESKKKVEKELEDVRF